jgi:type IV secretory pathway protease TraF
MLERAEGRGADSAPAPLLDGFGRHSLLGREQVAQPARMALARGYVHTQGLEPLVYGTRCASGAAVIGKPVAGVPGDTIEVTMRGVLVNGRLLHRSRVQQHDRSGRMLPAASQGMRILRAGEFWLQSEFAQNSFDSRIVGPVPANNILDRRVFVIGFAPLFCLTLTLLVAGATLARRAQSISGGIP